MFGLKGAARASAAVVVLALSVASANADVVVDFWSYNGATSGFGTLANNANLVQNQPIDAIFTVSGPINWFAAGGSTNQIGSFLTSAGGTISGFSSPDSKYSSQAAFEAQVMSVSGDATTSFFKITGSGSFSGGSVTHDDGASLYLDGNFASPAVSQAGETVAETGTFVTTPGTHTFVLDYVEGNGAPSQLTFATTGVPEVSTWGMMILGFFGIGFVAYRRRDAASFRVA